MRKLNLKNLFFASAAAAILGLAGCGGGSFSCTDKSKCPNDAASTQTDIDSCNAALAGACGSQYRTAAACGKSSQKCDGSGKTDENATAASCSAELAAVVSCCQQHQTAPGCS